MAHTQEAIINELTDWNDRVCFVQADEAQKPYPEAKHVGGRWVMTNKGDAANPKIRCRYVATETNQYNDLSFFASTPPLEAIRLLVSQMAHRKSSNGKPLPLSFCDATKAYFNACPKRDIFVRAPKELGLPPGTVGNLVRCAYGTRDAGALWEEDYAKILVDMGFQRGRSSPTVFHHRQRDITVVYTG